MDAIGGTLGGETYLFEAILELGKDVRHCPLEGLLKSTASDNNSALYLLLKPWLRHLNFGLQENFINF